MMALRDARWRDANQRHLVAALALVRDALQRHVARLRDEPAPDESRLEEQRGALAEARERMPAPPAVERVSAGFGLSAFERDTLLLCAAVELDAAFPALCTAALGDPHAGYATFGLALAALSGAHWSALTPGSPLRRWRLVEVAPGGSLTKSPLRIDERVLHFLAGAPHGEERLMGLVTPLADATVLAPSQAAQVERLVAAWSSRKDDTPLALLHLYGDDTVGKRAVAAQVCSGVGLAPSVLGADRIPTTPAEVVTLARLWEREAVLGGGALLIECDEALEGPQASALTQLLEQVHGPVLVATREQRHLASRPVISLEVQKPPAAEQRALWLAALGEQAAGLDGHVGRLASQFHVGAATIQTACEDALAAGGQTPEAELGERLWDACRALARPRIEELAQRIEPAATWDDLVLPEPQVRILRDMAAHVRQRATVYEDWGFAGKGNRGLGIGALFAGASGTGKTLAAEVLAHELRLDLYRIDLSATVSKYIGETEKNLRRVFDAAEEGGAILLFDEADALFGKRSEVKDSHDRYANIEVSYLLQRMEAYRGLAILTTNLKSALDPSFMRRIRFVVTFPFPDAAQRAEIWRRIFPAATPVTGLDVAKLARLNVAGGNIRTIALGAAFLAADAGEPVGMAHLLRAAQSEYAKLEKALTEAEVGGWM
jgi:hypothetical protein